MDYFTTLDTQTVKCACFVDIRSLLPFANHIFAFERILSYCGFQPVGEGALKQALFKHQAPVTAETWAEISVSFPYSQAKLVLSAIGFLICVGFMSMMSDIF